ncbi:hypothetical protein [Pendulispora albinea]|uniref:Transmembrane protein n=1 Tax=Pendulispora albinea TaxID=2741071 RepID=A0ABZ2LLT1_9BACT
MSKKRTLVACWVAVSTVGVACSAERAPDRAEQGAVEAASRSSGSVPAEERLYGVTVDDVSGISAITDSLARLAHKPTTRIVFDERVPATQYVSAAAAIHRVSHVMGEILDSYYVKDYTTEEYASRTREYLATLGDQVDIWEIGNEINGEWVGDGPTVRTKMKSAYDIVKGKGKTAALTLYYNEGCWERDDHEMFHWASANVPADMKQGLDYVLISYYEDDCENQRPDWQPIFDQLGQMFPSSKIGFGEVGTKVARKKASYLTRYYTMPIEHPRYIGGHFWWYFRQDMVPYTKPLFTTLNEAIR